MSNASADNRSSPQVFYEVAMNRLDAQMARLEAIDRKLGTLIGFASVIIAVLVATLQLGEFPPHPMSVCPHSAVTLLVLAGVSYVALIVFALRAYRFRVWDFRPNLEKLDEYCTKYSASTMREWVARECLRSYRENEQKLASKTSDGRKTIWLLAIETIFLVAAVFLTLICSG